MGVDALGFMLMILAVSMFIGYFVIRKTTVAVASGGAWLLVTVFAWTQTTYPVAFDIYTGLALFGVAMLAISIIMGVIGGKKDEGMTIINDDWSDIRSELDEIRKEREDMSFLYKSNRKRRTL